MHEAVTPKRTYLGDGVYVELEENDYYFKLYTLENPGIYLEDSVVVSFINFIRKHKPNWLKEIE